MCDKTKLKDDVKISQRDDLYLCFYPEKPDWVILYEKGARTLELLDGTRTVKEIAEELKKNFDFPMEKLDKDASDLLGVLKEKYFLEETPWKDEEPSFHLEMIWIHLTHKCNLRCKYCYVSAGKKMENEMTTEEVKRILDDFKALGEGKPQSVALSGGEPLLREDLWEIASYAKKLGIDAILATNGMLVDKETAGKIKDHFRLVHLSVDGLKEHHDELRGKGSYDKVIQAIENLNEAGAQSYISAVVTKKNLGDIPNLVELAHKYDIREVKSPPLMPIGRGLEELMPSNLELAELWRKTHEVEEKIGHKVHKVHMVNDKSVAPAYPLKYGKYACGAGVNSLSIDSDGSIYPCQAAQIERFWAGNIRERPLRDIWNDPESFKEWRSTTIQTIPKCSGCEWRKYCGGGCKMHAFTKHGTIKSPDPFCNLYYKLYEEGLWNHVYRRLNKEIIPEEQWEEVKRYILEKEDEN